MQTQIRLKLDMSARVAKFCDQFPLDTPAFKVAVAKLTDLVARAEALARQQRAGRLAVQASIVSRDTFRHGIRNDLMTLRHIADAAALRQPEIPIRLQLPADNVNHEVFLTTARVAVAEATTNKDVLLTYGMPETMLDGLTQSLNEYEDAVRRKFEGITSHVGASADLKAVTDEIMDVVRHLDALNDLRFRAEPEHRAAWQSARNVAWPLPDAANPAPAPVDVKPAA